MSHNAPDEYGNFVDSLKSKYSKLIRNISSDDDIKKLIVMYLDEVYSKELSNGEVIDFFCVDTPCIITAIEDQEMSNRVLEIFDELNPIYFAKYYGDNTGSRARV